MNRYLRRMRSLYAERRAALLEALAELPLDIHAAEAGLHCIGWLPEGMDDRALAAEAAVHGVDLVPISIFSLEPLPRKGFVFGYGEFNVARIKDDVRRLAAAIRSA